MHSYILPISFIALVVAGVSEGQCPCTLENAVKYPGTYQWNCKGLGLDIVPTECFDEQSENVTELILTNNRITTLRDNAFPTLVDLKALFLDTNYLNYFDVAALNGIEFLEYFNIEHNTNLVNMPSTIFDGMVYLEQVYFVGTPVKNLPPMTSSRVMDTLDARSCKLTTLPRPLFAKSLTGSTFLFNMIGNAFVDVAADILLPIPNGATVYLDSTVLIWTKDMFQYYDVINKNWNININLDTNLLVCDYDGNPKDPTMC